MIVENSGHTGIAILSPDANAGGIVFGNPSDTTGAGILWDYTKNNFKVGTWKAGAILELASGDDATAMTISSTGVINATSLKGTYSNGEAYLCVYDNGTIFAKDSACS